MHSAIQQSVIFRRGDDTVIINASGRTDVVGFYLPWFIQRLKNQELYVRNPYYTRQVSKLVLDPRQIDLIIFCTKNPIPLLDYLDELSKYSLMIQVSITPYGKEIEPGVPDKRDVISTTIALSKQLIQASVQVRYDPIFLSKKYTIGYHEMMFERLCEKLAGSIHVIIISFIDMMKNTQANAQAMKLIEIDEEKMKEIARRFSLIATKYQMKIKTCAENVDLSMYGIFNEPCYSAKEVFEITGVAKKYKKGKWRGSCECIETIDIGAYNSCPHGCLYCYANYDAKLVSNNFLQHDINSNFIIGNLKESDEIKVRK